MTARTQRNVINKPGQIKARQSICWQSSGGWNFIRKSIYKHVGHTFRKPITYVLSVRMLESFWELGWAKDNDKKVREKNPTWTNAKLHFDREIGIRGAWHSFASLFLFPSLLLAIVNPLGPLGSRLDGFAARQADFGIHYASAKVRSQSALDQPDP